MNKADMGEGGGGCNININKDGAVPMRDDRIIDVYDDTTLDT